MRKSAIAAIIIAALCVPLTAGAADTHTTLRYQVVVDGTTRNKALNDYALLTRDAIQRVWKTPLDLDVPGALKGRVRIDYIVRRSGQLESVRIVKGSGRPEMDRSLMKAIRSAQPFPPFPDGVEAGRILVRANFIVADLPTAGVTRVSQPLPLPKKPSAAPNTTSLKKLMWGRPAGTSVASTDTKQGVKPPRPPAKKLMWGATR
jgi:TonB family protein